MFRNLTMLSICFLVLPAMSARGQSFTLVETTYTDPVINFGPLSFGLSKLPAEVNDTFFLGEGFPTGGGATGWGLGEVVSASLMGLPCLVPICFGDLIAPINLVAFDLEIDAGGAIEAFSYTFAPFDTPTVSDGVIEMNGIIGMNFLVTGTDIASGQAFSYTYAHSTTTVSSVPEPDCDFDEDGSCDVTDLDLMQALGPLVAGVNASGNESFDLDGNGTIDLTDRDQWLTDAATVNGFASAYKLGDANIDGAVDGQDFIAWNGSKFTSSLLWSEGNFNADDVVDGQDFILWNGNKFTSSDGLSAVPEPATGTLSLVGLLLFGAARMRPAA